MTASIARLAIATAAGAVLALERDGTEVGASVWIVSVTGASLADRSGTIAEIEAILRAHGLAEEGAAEPALWSHGDDADSVVWGLEAPFLRRLDGERSAHQRLAMEADPRLRVTFES